MSYLATDQRTQVLLEAIEDAEQLLELTSFENRAATAETLLRQLIATAKRHYHHPENDRKRTAEYEASKAKEAAVPQPVEEVPQPITKEEVF